MTRATTPAAPGEIRSRSSRKLGKKILLAAVSTFLFLLTCELLCRALEPAPRWKSLISPKPKGTFRILAFGGSTTWGLPIQELGFVAQLEAGLRRLEPQKRLEVINLGYPGEASDYVLESLRGTVHASPDLLIVLTGHNEYINRAGEHSAVQDAIHRLARISALLRTAERLSQRTQKDRIRPEERMPERQEPYDPHSAWYKRKASRFQFYLEEIAQTARKRKVPLYLCTAPCNLADWPPVYRGIAWSKSNPGYQADVERLKTLLTERKYKDLDSECDVLTQRFGDDAMVAYLKGKSLQGMDRTSEALALFRKAKDQDPFPYRAFEDFNRRIRSFATKEGARVVDVEAGLVEQAPGGLVGFDLMADNAHPSPKGSAAMARRIAQTMSEDGFFLSRGGNVGDPEEWDRAWNAVQLGSAKRGIRHMFLLVGTANYCMKPPFYNFEAARAYLEKAVRLYPEIWQTWANLGTLCLLENRTGEAREQLARAVKLKGAPLDTESPKQNPCLAAAARRAHVDLIEWGVIPKK